MDGTQAKVWKCLGQEAIDMVWDLMCHVESDAKDLQAGENTNAVER